MRRRQVFARKDPFHEMSERIEQRSLRIDELSDSILADMFEGEFGKPPHHRMKRTTIVERLNDACDKRP